MIITWQASIFKTFFRKGKDEKGNTYYHVQESNTHKERFVCITPGNNLGYGSTTLEALSWAKRKDI